MKDDSILRFEGKERSDDLVVPPEIGKPIKLINCFEGKLFISGVKGFVEFNTEFESTRLTLTKVDLLFAGEQHGQSIYFF